jgi:hypothetical protein
MNHVTLRLPLRLTTLILWVSSTLHVSGCAERATPQQPPSLRAPSQEIDPVKPSMWALSSEVSVLRELVERSAPPDDVARAEMTRRLLRIDEIMKTLALVPAGTKHPLLSAELGSFRDDVAAARESVTREPFDPTQIRLVTDGCKRCHVVATMGGALSTTIAQRP